MPVELPNDVWFFIVKNYIDIEEGKSELANLASTNKHIREVALPTLFERLVFKPRFQSGPENSPMHNIHCGRDRALSLRNCPHLLYHVRSFEINYWSGVIGTREEMVQVYASEQEWTETKYQHVDVLTELWSLLYDIATSLVLELPRLKTLRIFESPVTLRLHSIFYRITTLEQLELNDCDVPDARMAAGLIEPYPLTIKELHYETVPDDIPHPYFQRLLESCLPSLTTLTSSGVDISMISEVARNHRLPLRNLDLTYFLTLSVEEDPRELCAFLMACPDLRVIRLDDGACMELGELQGSLVNLESVSASIKVVRQLASGRPVRRVEFLDSGYEANPADFGTVWSSSVPIRRVHLEHCLAECPFEKAIIKNMTRALPHVTHLTIDTTFMSIWSAVLPSRIKNISRSNLLSQELNELMVGCIAQWPELIYCRIYSKSITEPDESVTEELAECPIAPRGNTNERGHPTLNEVRLCSRFTWIWIPMKGWVPEIKKRSHAYERSLISWSWNPMD